MEPRKCSKSIKAFTPKTKSLVKNGLEIPQETLCFCMPKDI